MAWATAARGRGSAIDAADDHFRLERKGGNLVTERALANRDALLGAVAG